MSSTQTIQNTIISVVSIWITLIAPFSILIAWTNNQSPLPYLLPSLLLAPVSLLASRWLLHLTKRLTLFWLMQLFGLGCIVLLCTTVGGLLTFLLPYRTAATVVVILALLLTWRAVANANTIRNIHLDISSPLLTKPLKVVQLSDVHIGSRDKHFLRKVINQANQHGPDVVVITGDLVDRDYITSADLHALKLLSCPVFMSTGNHEFDIDIERCLQAIRAQGVEVLRDTSTRFGEIDIIGIDDRKRGKQIEPVLNMLNPSESTFSLLLYHRPDGWEPALQYPVDLMLAGHTHSGQIWPFSYLVKTYYRQLVGYFSHAGKHLYVSTGTGTWGPVMRLGSVGEMTVILLNPEQ